MTAKKGESLLDIINLIVLHVTAIGIRLCRSWYCNHRTGSRALTDACKMCKDQAHSCPRRLAHSKRTHNKGSFVANVLIQERMQ